MTKLTTAFVFALCAALPGHCFAALVPINTAIAQYYATTGHIVVSTNNIALLRFESPGLLIPSNAPSLIPGSASFSATVNEIEWIGFPLGNNVGGSWIFDAYDLGQLLPAGLSTSAIAGMPFTYVGLGAGPEIPSSLTYIPEPSSFALALTALFTTLGVERARRKGRPCSLYE